MRYPFILTLAILILSANAFGQREGHEHSSNEITLDNGNKWVVPESMMVYLDNMVKEVTTARSSKAAEFSVIHRKLEGNIDKLTSNCTMTGQAHDELHKWLVPFIDLVNSYTDDHADTEKKEWLAEVDSSLTTFGKYFK